MSEPQLRVAVTEEGSRRTVGFSGELDMNVEAEAIAALDAAGRSGGDVVLDLRALDFIDSTGLKVVVRAFRLLCDAGVGFSVVRGPAHVQDPFRSAGLDDVLPFVDVPPG